MEQEIVARLQHPDTKEAAFRQLIGATQRPLYSHIRNLVLNHDDADDVLQNTYLKVFTRISTFKGSSTLFTWMYRIATNQALDYLRERSRSQKMTLEAYLSGRAETLQHDPYFDADQAGLLLQKTVAALPHKQQLVFKMKYFDQISYEQMSEILETSVGALKASYHHAVKKIENELKRSVL